MRSSLPLLSALLLPLLSAALPTPTPSLSLSARAAITSLPSATAPPSRRDDNFAPSIPPVSLNLPTVSVAEPSIPSLSLNLPPETCTPGFSSYATPGPDGYVSADTCNALWVYFPNFAAAVAFSVLFGMLTIAHVGQAVLYHNGFCWVIIMAGLWETGAYAFRALGSKNQQSSGIATVAQILVLVAPIWVNAFAYMVFARIVHFYSPTRKIWFFSPSILALVFVTLDIVSFVIQLVGGGMAGPGASPESQKKGLNIYMGGIGMQEGFIVLFLGLVITFHRDQLQAERVGRLTADKIGGWKWLIWALYGCLLAITIRIIYRLAEFSAGLGASNPLPSNEPLLYVLESTPMWLAILAWNIVHPGRFIHGADAKMPPSWLSRHLCCCCRKRRCDECNGKLGHAGAHHHHRLADGSELEDNQEMHPVPKTHRGRVAAAPAKPRDSSPNGTAREQLRLRPQPAADNHREVSPEPPSYTAHRPREFLS
ncbi:RTA1 like protein-domain-containing protein [Massariosphaeria phaeospora]|uniref:RTA1 like protein-domain-containing protein n=1 Tax=Massariosphaeria phaeospora TaxID=100035 RepID=A0A7C8MJ89_9PLEO|nr:RTA1 like protein-domain-containing protein [Massariosphaeria phaeospora]